MKNIALQALKPSTRQLQHPMLPHKQLARPQHIFPRHHRQATWTGPLQVMESVPRLGKRRQVRPHAGMGLFLRNLRMQGSRRFKPLRIQQDLVKVMLVMQGRSGLALRRDRPLLVQVAVLKRCHVISDLPRGRSPAGAIGREHNLRHPLTPETLHRLCNHQSRPYHPLNPTCSHKSLWLVPNK